MKQYVTALKQGKTITRKACGRSMQPYIMDKSDVVVRPIEEGEEISPRDIVVCKVRGRYHCHFVGAVKGNQYRIENAKGHVNGWTTREHIYGKVVR